MWGIRGSPPKRRYWRFPAACGGRQPVYGYEQGWAGGRKPHAGADCSHKVAIPPELRLLNLALVDIGAGTSDIALTKGGSVIAYAMAPTAGDKITEKICQHYLVDFNKAEKMKISLSTSRESIDFVDIMKIKHSVKASDMLEVIKPVVDVLAATISQKILNITTRPRTRFS